MTLVTLTVNGTEVTLDVEPRLTLADALRQRLGLTGTHLGCEHGVCGACTVLMGDLAVRSCLLFCVQADGATITTVEALGDVDELHPLQEAFRRHHGLQCGFCTPGFLMSAYELLRDGAGSLDDHTLREQLSGVLCRCTGYAGIVDAVREIAASYPQGIPEPKAVGRPILVRSGARGPGPEAVMPAAAMPAPAMPPQPTALSVPEGEPNETVEVTTTVSPSPAEVWTLLSDFGRMSRCMPGVELEPGDREDTYAGTVRVNLGPMRLSFAGAARVLERNDADRTLRAVAAGRDPSGSAVRALVALGAQPSDSGAVVRARAKLYLSGRAAQFGRAIAGDVSRQLFNEFGACVERTLTTGGAARPRRLAGGALAWRLLRARVRELVRRLIARGTGS